MLPPRFALCVVAVALLTAAVRCEELPAHALARLGTSDRVCGDEFAAVAVSADGKYLAASGYSGPLRIWELATGKALALPQVREPHATSLMFLADNQTLLICASNQVYTWDVTRNALATDWQLASGYPRLVVSPDGKLLAATSDKHDLMLLNREDHSTRSLAGHKAYTSAVAFSPDGKTLASGSNDRTLRLWDVATAKERHVCSGHDDQVSAVAFSPDSKTVVSASWDGTLRVWDGGTGKERHHLKGHRYEIHTVAFAPDGKSLASGSADGTVRIWDAGSGKELYHWTVHTSGVLALAYTKDGKLVTIDALHNVQLWDATKGKELRRFGDKGEGTSKDYVYCCAWGPERWKTWSRLLRGTWTAGSVCTTRSRARRFAWSAGIRAMSGRWRLLRMARRWRRRRGDRAPFDFGMWRPATWSARTRGTWAASVACCSHPMASH